MARLLWLADVLRGAGLTVVEYDSWRTRGADTFGPVRGIICHHTGSSIRSTDTSDVRALAVTGTPSAPTVPISQLFLSRNGAWWVLASGTATGVKTGTGGPLKGYGDDAVLQIEAQHAGAVEEWTPDHYASYVRGCAALAAKLELDVRYVVGHKEHQPGEKNDPSFDMNVFRRDVAAIMNGDDMLTPDQANTQTADTWRLLAVLNNLDAAEYHLPGEKEPRREPNLLKARLDEIAEKLDQPISDEQLERVMRKILGMKPNP